MGTPPALNPAAVGRRLSMLAAVVAAAVMFGVGMFAGKLVAHTAGWTGAVDAGLTYGTAAALAVFSVQGSARRIYRARRRAAG